MSCGCGKGGNIPQDKGSPDVLINPAAAPHPTYRAVGVQYGASMLTSPGGHVGPASHPATNQSSVKTGPDSFANVTQTMRAGVFASHVLDTTPPLASRRKMTLGNVGTTIVQAAKAVSVVMVKGYAGQMPLDQQPSMVKPYPWAAGVPQRTT